MSDKNEGNSDSAYTIGLPRENKCRVHGLLQVIISMYENTQKISV